MGRRRPWPWAPVWHQGLSKNEIALVQAHVRFLTRRGFQRFSGAAVHHLVVRHWMASASSPSAVVSITGYPTSRGAVLNGMQCVGTRFNHPVHTLTCVDRQEMLDAFADATGMPRFVFPVDQRPGVNLRRWLLRVEAAAWRSVRLRGVLAGM